MSENTTIEWCDASINFWHGCTKVSPGCKNCYAEKWDKRKMHSSETHFGKGVPRLNLLQSARKQALKLDRKAVKLGKRLRVFTNSMGDWLDDEVPIEWLAFLLETVAMTPHLDWLLLTKRPENFWKRVDEVGTCGKFEREEDWKTCPAWIASQWSIRGESPPNVWIGTSVENQVQAEFRIPRLLNIPAKVHFLSCEPLLGPVELRELIIETEGSGEQHFDCLECDVPAADDGGFDEEVIDLVIVGGESGTNARPMDPDWARSIKRDCHYTGTAFFMKQMGGKRKPFPPIPDDLMVREFPEVEMEVSP